MEPLVHALICLTRKGNQQIITATKSDIIIHSTFHEKLLNLICCTKPILKQNI